MRVGVGLPQEDGEETCSEDDALSWRAPLRSLAAPAIARAQKFPASRVTMVVPFPAGAATDLGARVYSSGCRRSGGSPWWSTTRAEGQRHSGGGVRGTGQAGRAHDLRDLGDDPGCQSSDLRQAALRSDRELRSGHAHGPFAVRAAGRRGTARLTR